MSACRFRFLSTEGHGEELCPGDDAITFLGSGEPTRIRQVLVQVLLRRELEQLNFVGYLISADADSALDQRGAMVAQQDEHIVLVGMQSGTIAWSRPQQTAQRDRHGSDGASDQYAISPIMHIMSVRG